MIVCFSRADENYFGGEIKSINKGNTEVMYIYWRADLLGGIPEELKTALQDLNFEGKIAKPFVTHEGSGISQFPRAAAKALQWIENFRRP